MKLLAFRCGRCGAIIGIPSERHSQRVCCGRCGEVLQLPSQPTEIAIDQAGQLSRAVLSPSGAELAASNVLPSQAGSGALTTSATQELTSPLPHAEPVNQSVEGQIDTGTLPHVSPVSEHVFADSASATLGATSTEGVGVPSAMAATEMASHVGTEVRDIAASPTLEHEQHRLRPTTGAQARRIPLTYWLLVVLLPTTVTFIVLSIILFRFWIDERAKKARHPLEDLPETIELTSDAGGRPRYLSPLVSYPQTEFIRIGQTKAFDGVEVSPLRVRLEHVVYARTQDGRTGIRHPDRMLVLYLRIRNITDHVFQPLDPIYNTFFRNDVPVYTYAVVNEERFYGPVQDAAVERIVGQDFSEIWPAPKNSADDEKAPTMRDRSVLETIVVAYQSPNKVKIADALADLPPDTVLRWYVQLRKGRQDRLIKKTRRKLWLTTVVPVEFRRDQIEEKNLADTAQ